MSLLNRMQFNNTPEPPAPIDMAAHPDPNIRATYTRHVEHEALEPRSLEMWGHLPEPCMYCTTAHFRHHDSITDSHPLEGSQ